MQTCKTIKKGTEFLNEANGYNYRIMKKNYESFLCEASDEYDEELGDYINYEECLLTYGEVSRLVGAKIVNIYEQD